jgi:hypothetical protein
MKKILLAVVILYSYSSFCHSQIIYSLGSCAYSPIAGVGTALPNCDDCMSGMVPLGFTFNFWGTNYTTCDICSNGWLTFNAGMPPTYPGQTIPYASIPTMVAFSWDDMYTVGATVNYFTSGVAPNRIFVVNYNSVGFCCTAANQATVQIQLYETTNQIRILSANNNHIGRSGTMGIQSIGNGNLVVPGRNAASWASAANECQSFTPGPPPPPANDNPCSAAALTVSGSCFYGTYTNVSATNTAGIPAPGCASYSGGDVWFSAVVPAGGSINFDTQIMGINDCGMAVYSGTCAAMSLVACDANNSPNGNMPMISLTGQTPGTTLWIRVWDEGNNNFGTFGICAVDPNAPPPVMGSGVVYMGSNTGNPWGSTSNQSAMNTVFGVGGWSQQYFETANPATTFVAANCFIFMEGGDFTANAMNTFITANMTAIENWVAIGGRLIMNAAPNTGSNMNYGFGGVTLNYNGGSTLEFNGNASPGQAGHPIFNGPSLPAGTSYTGNYFAHAFITGGSTTALIEDVPGPSLTQKIWGNGRVLFGGMTTSNWHSPTPNGDNLMVNIVKYQQSCVTPLPVELVSFTGTCSDNGTLLKWQTSSEINNAFFTIESSVDAITYVQEATIPGLGNSNQLHEYTFLSPFRSYPGNYFRLIQKDFDGKETSYPPVYISCHSGNNANCAVVNNNGNQIELSLYSPKDDLFHCILTDLQGKTIASIDRQVPKGTSTIRFDGTSLSSGVYVLIVNGSNSQCSNKFIVH